MWMMTLRTKRFWTEAISRMLYPFVITEEIYLENILTIDVSGHVPLHKLIVT